MFTKSPTEVVTLGVDFTESMRADLNEKISSANVSAKDEDGTDVTSSLIQLVTNSDYVINAQIKDGTSGKRYIITFTGSTTLGDEVEAKIVLDVKVM